MFSWHAKKYADCRQTVFAFSSHVSLLSRWQRYYTIHFFVRSVAILRYLARTFPVPDHWFPKESTAQAKVDEYLEWQHLNIRVNGTLFFWEKYVVPRNTKMPADEKKAANFLKGYKNCLEQVETVWLKDRPFVGGKEISIADLLATAEMEQTGIIHLTYNS